MKLSSILLFAALVCLAHYLKADSSPKEEDDNYRRELLELYKWTKTEFKPLILTMLNMTSQVVRNATEDPRLFEGQDPAVIQPFVDKVKRMLSNFEEVMNNADTEDVTEKTMEAIQNLRQIKLLEGVTESAEKHLDSIKQEYFQKSMNELEDILEKPSKEAYDKFVPRFDEAINKLTPSEREANPALTSRRNTKKQMFPDKLESFYHLWDFLCWSHDELHVVEPSKID